MNYIKYRGHKHNGRGHRKNGSGRRGGTGFAGAHKHKLTYVKAVYKKRQRYISAELIIKNIQRYVLERKVLVQNGNKYIILAALFPKILDKHLLTENYELRTGVTN